MQDQRTLHQTVTANQSLQVVQTLLRAGFGCITYLRGLLPDENFTEGHLTSSGSSSFSQDGESQPGKKPPYGSVKVKTIKKGWSMEGNRLLEYLEGIFEALEKQYLRSFIFAVYLDDEDPENIVEAYTFNFSYHTVAGTTTKVPIMTLGDRLDKMSLNPGSIAKLDPVAAAISKGKAPSLGDVKQSVRVLIKTLIAAVQVLHPLPRRRFATFKLFYMGHVPDNYEPPHFMAGDAKNKYFFTTHAKNETPEKISIGSLVTPYHGVQMHVASISEVIPRGSDNDTARFADLVNCEDSSYAATQNMTLAERGKLIDAQKQDALLRKIVWDAEAFANPYGNLDADGEYDPEYQGPYDNLLTQQPTGMRREDGTVVEITQGSKPDESMNSTPRGYPGAPIDEPNDVKKIMQLPSLGENIATQIAGSMPYNPPDSSFTQPLPSPRLSEPPAFENNQESVTSRGIDTQFMQDIIEQRDAEAGQIFFSADNAQDTEMLDLETQPPVNGASHSTEDPIESFPSQTASPHNETMQSVIPETSVPSNITLPRDPAPTTNDVDVAECDCGVPEDEDYGACQCEGPCGRWLHVWCMGYHSVEDSRLPHVFRCFVCRLRNDPQIEVLDSRNLTSEYVAKFKDLSLFRRALKVIEVHRPENVTRFKELLGSEVSTAGQAWKRLETEGFIVLQTTQMDGVGLLETQTTAPSRKGKGKQKARKNIKRAKYAPVPEAMNGKKFTDYFEPATEASLLGLTKLQHNTRTSKVLDNQPNPKTPSLTYNVEPQAQPESQTQLSTQDSTSQNPAPVKRKGTREDAPQKAKRLKISVGLGINLED